MALFSYRYGLSYGFSITLLRLITFPKVTVGLLIKMATKGQSNFSSQYLPL